MGLKRKEFYLTANELDQVVEFLKEIRGNKMTPEEMKILAKCERDMDAGKVGFVVVDGFRIMVEGKVMSEFGLKSGQSVSRAMSFEIMKKHLSNLNQEIEREKPKLTIV